MKPQFLSLEEAAALVKDGDLVGMTAHLAMAPMALLRELIRRGSKGLRLVLAPTGAIGADLLIGAGAVQEVEFSYLDLGEFGFAPCFTRKAREGALTLKDTC